jgi:hypothetical protein
MQPAPQNEGFAYPATPLSGFHPGMATPLLVAAVVPVVVPRIDQESHTMKRNSLLPLAVALLATASLPAFADCPAPTNPGAVICFPSSNSPITYPMNIEAAATGRNGLPIVRMMLYSDSQKIDQMANTGTLAFSDVNDIYNQSYHLVLNAWDSEGNLYRAFATVKVIDGAYACSHPASGIKLCSPPNGSYQPDSGVQLVAWGSANVTSMNAWLNGTLIDVANGNVLDAITGGSNYTQWQTFNVKAYHRS